MTAWGQPSYPRTPGLLRTLAVFAGLVELGAWALFGPMTLQAHRLALEGLRHAGAQHGPAAGNVLGGLLGGGGAAPKAKAAKAVAWALAQRGKPYRWGSSGPDAFDCSGLVQAAWAHAGVRIPRTAADQLARLPRVHGHRRPGDLIVYPSDGPSRRHVAMVTGPGRMVEALGEGIPVRVVAVHGGELGTVRPGGRR
jgi:cell wall-associated NlpC family hydrolase